MRPRLSVVADSSRGGLGALVRGSNWARGTEDDYIYIDGIDRIDRISRIDRIDRIVEE